MEQGTGKTKVVLDIRGVIASASLKRHHQGPSQLPEPDIRGVIASASLKQESLALVKIMRLQQYPRRYRLGLIEASGNSVNTPLPHTKYPRRYRLGLIEAALKISAPASRPANIRGVIASASLKRPAGSFRRGLRSRYPRRYRLGLIEAREARQPRPLG